MERTVKHDCWSVWFMERTVCNHCWSVCLMKRTVWNDCWTVWLMQTTVWNDCWSVEWSEQFPVIAWCSVLVHMICSLYEFTLGWCHVKCCCFGASSVYTIQPCTRLECHFIQSHMGRVYACLAVTCHLHFWQNDRDLLRATAVTRGWNGYRNESAQKVDPGEENSPAAPAGIRTHDLSITSPAL